MIIKTLIKKGAYHDSVTLMQTAKRLNALSGVKDSAVVMATRENKNIIKSSGLLTSEIEGAGDNDLAIAVMAESYGQAEAALKAAEELLTKKQTSQNSSGSEGRKARSLDGALQSLYGANMAVISVAGRFAGKIAMDCLDKGLNVMLFSDNVPVETEIALKKKASARGLLLMGPDCGTAIINGVPLAFANAVRKGSVGIVAAAGTGLQEVSSLISNEGAGISQAIGTGGRDIKEEVGGITMLEGLRILSKDPHTSVIVIVSKPPHPSVMARLLKAVRKIEKPVVSVLLGGNIKEIVKDDFYPARTLEEAALKAACLAKGEKVQRAKEIIYDRNLRSGDIIRRAVARQKGGKKYLRGLFSGGTFVSEAQFVLDEIIGPVWSNVPLDKKYKLKNSLELKENSVIDLGEDEFTVGRPHPMMDYSLRNRLIETEGGRKDTGVILLDLVLGYGSNMKPLEDILPSITKAFHANTSLSVVASVTGTEADPQGRSRVVKGLEAVGVIVAPSNAAACRLAGEIIRMANGR